MHPWSQDPVRTGYAVARGFPTDLALGSFEYLEVLTRTSHFTNTSKIWHRALNCGYKITASAGEDSILGMNATPVLGQSRIYVQSGRELKCDGCVDGIRRGRTRPRSGDPVGTWLGCRRRSPPGRPTSRRQMEDGPMTAAPPTVSLAYGRGAIDVPLQDGALVITPQDDPALPDPATSLRDALRDPWACRRCASRCAPG